MLFWNLNPTHYSMANAARAAGARVLVMENAYLNFTDKPAYAIAEDGHNGSGTWHVGDPDRIDFFNISKQIKPWRGHAGRHILVLEQRGIGRPDVASPKTLRPLVEASTARHNLTKHKILYRQHPGRHAEPRLIPLETALAEAVCAITWNSQAATKALLLGIPVYALSKFYIMAQCAFKLETFPCPKEPDRWFPLVQLAWAQATLDEISSGLAFHRVLYGDNDMTKVGPLYV